MKYKRLITEYFYINHFVYFLFAYFVLHLLLRVSISTSLELDEAEQILLSQSFSWGYNTQPPLYTWLQMLFFELFGSNIFALSLLKNSLLFLTYFFVYKSTKLISGNHTIALIATASLILIPQISWESQRDLTHSVLLTTITSVIFYIFMKIKYTSSNNNLRYHILLGLLIAAGILSKYSFLVFIVSLTLTSLFDMKLRQFIFSKKSIITILLICIGIFPHAIWLSDHLDLATHATMQKLNITEGTFSFLAGIAALFKAIILFLMPYLIFVLLIFRQSIQFKKNVFLWYFFVIVISVLVLFIAYTDTTQIKDRWMQPYFFLMVIYIASMINVDKLKIMAVKRYFKIIYTMMFVILMVMFARIYFPDSIKKYYRLTYPFHPLSQQVKASGFHKGLILAEDKLIAGNMKLNFPKSTVLYSDYKIKPKKKFKNILIVWNKEFPVIAEKYKSYMTKKQLISENYLHSSLQKYLLNFTIIHLPDSL